MAFVYLLIVIAIIGWIGLALQVSYWVDELTGVFTLSFMALVAVLGFPIALFITICGG